MITWGDYTAEEPIAKVRVTHPQPDYSIITETVDVPALLKALARERRENVALRKCLTVAAAAVSLFVVAALTLAIWGTR